MNGNTKPLRDRFWSKVEIPFDATINECWEWKAHRSRDGYGKIQVWGNSQKANRVSWFLHNGELPNGLCVLHKCDNPACVNPHHLFLGTQAENNRDAAIKGRRADKSGSKNGRSKLTKEQVLEIRQSGLSTKNISLKYGICLSAAFNVRSGRTYKNETA